MYTDMEEWTEIRLRVLNGKASKREILREKGMHWKTLQKILSHSKPPGYRMESERPRPKIGPFLERISEILESDKEVPKKQRHPPHFSNGGPNLVNCISGTIVF